MICLILLTNLLNIFNQIQANTDPLRVSTNNGIVRGTYLTAGNKKQVIAWLGIPYAKAGRFEGPVPADKWNQPLNANKFGPTCYQESQILYRGSIYWNKIEKFDENCLSLNIYKPSQTKPNAKLSVLVWIHSGAFTSGSSSINLFDMKEFVSLTNTIAITFNYRLGAFGFLKTNNKVTGNMGLLDQQQALKWVRKNIKQFGGDPNKVTLAGEGAGAVSVSYHLLAKNGQKLFQQAIILNGDLLSDWYFDSKEHAIEKTNMLGEAMNCPSNENALVRCLKEKSAQDIVDSQQDLNIEGFDEYPFLPTVHKAFLPNIPRNLTSNLNLNGMNILVSSTRDAGSLATREILPMEDDNEMDEELFKHFAEPVLYRYPQQLQEKAIEFYKKQDRQGPSFERTINNLVGDLKYACSIQKFADILVTKGAQVRKAFFHHRPQHSKWPKWAGVVQQDDVMFILGEPLKQTPVIKFYQNEQKLSKRLIELFGRFVKQEALKRWPKYENRNKTTLVIEKAHFNVVNNRYHREKFCNFWRKNGVFV